jgi:hypothetical protein
MTEAEWLAWPEPDPMIEFLERGHKGTCRQRRLFGVACCRRIWPFRMEEKIRRIVEVAEEYADGQASAAKLRAAHRRSCTLCKKDDISPDKTRTARSLHNAAIAVNWVSACNARFRTNDRRNALYPEGYHHAAAGYVSGAAATAAFFATYEGADAVEMVRLRKFELVATPAGPIFAAEEKAQADLLRCIFGNPFRPSPPPPLATLAWNDGTVVKLAQALYEERAFERLPVLADALEDAGFSDASLLGHLRGPGPHCRGCFVLDGILGKQ